MAQDQSPQEQTMAEEVAENPGARTAAIHQNPEIIQEEARNANAGEQPNAAGGASKPQEAENHVPSRSDPNATDLPTANTPDPDQANSANPNAS